MQSLLHKNRIVITDIKTGFAKMQADAALIFDIYFSKSVSRQHQEQHVLAQLTEITLKITVLLTSPQLNVGFRFQLTTFSRFLELLSPAEGK